MHLSSEPMSSKFYVDTQLPIDLGSTVFLSHTPRLQSLCQFNIMLTRYAKLSSIALVYSFFTMSL